MGKDRLINTLKSRHLTPDTHKTRKKQQAYETKDKQSDGERNSKEHILRGLKYTV